MQHLSDSDADKPAALPARLEPMMLAHYALTGDDQQRRDWQDRIESVRQMEAVEREQDPEAKRLLSRRRVWDRIRAVGKTGAATGLAMGAVWMSWLLPLYAIDHGFGWPAALAYLLPVPIAYKLARRMWERAALSGMRDLGWRPTLARRLSAFPRAAIRSVLAGYSFGFTLVFVQALISWFMTPAPTVALELYADFMYGAVGGLIGATGSLALAPLLAKPAP